MQGILQEEVFILVSNFVLSTRDGFLVRVQQVLDHFISIAVSYSTLCQKNTNFSEPQIFFDKKNMVAGSYIQHNNNTNNLIYE